MFSRAQLVALSLLAGASRLAQAEVCPTNSFSVGSGASFYEESPTAAIWNFSPFAAYDLVAGKLQVDLTGSGEAGSSAGLTIQDRYRITGPASGTPIPVSVRMSFAGSAGGGFVSLPFGGTQCLGSQVHLRLASGSAVHQVDVSSL